MNILSTVHFSFRCMIITGLSLSIMNYLLESATNIMRKLFCKMEPIKHHKEIDIVIFIGAILSELLSFRYEYRGIILFLLGQMIAMNSCARFDTMHQV